MVTPEVKSLKRDLEDLQSGSSSLKSFVKNPFPSMCFLYMLYPIIMASK